MTDPTANPKTAAADRPQAVAARAKRTGDRWVVAAETVDSVAVLDNLGHDVWALCDGSRTAADIAIELSTETDYDVQGVEEFLQELRMRGLIV